MIFLFICGFAFGVGFVLRFLTGISWLSLAVPTIGCALLAFWGGQPEGVVVLVMVSLGLFGAAWGVLAAKMLKTAATWESPSFL